MSAELIKRLSEKRMNAWEQAKEILEVAEAEARDLSAETLAAHAAELYAPADPRGGALQMMTVHKAKGLEWPRVYGLRKTLYPRKTRDIEECNIEYVLITRAMDSLIWIED